MPYTYFSPPTLIARNGYAGQAGLGGVLDTIGSFVKDGAKAALDVFKTGQQSAGQAQAYQQIATQQAQLAAQKSSVPSWVLPVGAVAAAGLVAVMVLKKKK